MGLSLWKTVTLDRIPKKEGRDQSQWDRVSGIQSPWTEFPRKKEEISHNGTESLENSHPGLNSQEGGRDQSQWD